MDSGEGKGKGEGVGQRPRHAYLLNPRGNESYAIAFSSYNRKKLYYYRKSIM